MVSFGRPEPQVDKFSNLHLLYQEGPHSFNYTVINPDGEIIARRTYDYVDKRPRLQPDAEGKILVRAACAARRPRMCPVQAGQPRLRQSPNPHPRPAR